MNSHLRSLEEIKQRQQLCKDLDYLVREDESFREEILDEFVYLISNKRLEDLTCYVQSELQSDF
jgi:hypothetical protein